MLRSRVPHALAAALAALAVVAAPALAQEVGPDSAVDGTTPQDGGSAPREESSEPTPARAGRISLDADRSRVRVGESVTFTGRRQPGRRGDRVKLWYRPAGGDYTTVARTTTDAAGNYELSVRPRRNGSFVAVSPQGSGDALRSGRELVSVRAEVSAEARKHQLKSRGVKVRGQLRPRDAGRRVIVERRTPKGWEQVASARTDSSGAYAARWDGPSLGGHALRVRFRGDDLNLGARDALRHKVRVYREDHASYYGPGFYGNTTACGQTLRRGTVGVAHKRLPCGTRVRFRYRGTTKRITVIDRGPFIAGRRWDLTDAARRKLGFPKGTDDIWADR